MRKSLLFRQLRHNQPSIVYKWSETINYRMIERIFKLLNVKSILYYFLINLFLDIRFNFVWIFILFSVQLQIECFICLQLQRKNVWNFFVLFQRCRKGDKAPWVTLSKRNICSSDQFSYDSLRPGTGRGRRKIWESCLIIVQNHWL